MLEQLNTIGVALSAERDHERLLKLILSKSREVTTADAGSLFLVESIDEPIGPEDKKGDQARVQSRWLVFRLAQNDSREIKFEEEVLQINHDSVAGHVALSGQTLKIEDAYHLPPDLSFTFNGRIDEATGYRSRSMLVVPMQNREGETIGVLQLINKKPDARIRLSTPESFEKNVVSFSDLDERMVRSLASQAAVSVENNALYQRIEKLLDNFVEASVMAIESPRSRHQGPLPAGRQDDRLVGPSNQRNRNRCLSQLEIERRRNTGAEIRGTSPRFRKGRRRREVPEEIKEAIEWRVRHRTRALRDHPSKYRGPSSPGHAGPALERRGYHGR